MTQDRILQQVGLCSTGNGLWLEDIERGKRNVSLLNLELIAKGFGLII